MFSGSIGVPEERAQGNRKLPGPVRQEERGPSSCLGEGNRGRLQKWPRPGKGDKNNTADLTARAASLSQLLMVSEGKRLRFH